MTVKDRKKPCLGRRLKTYLLTGVLVTAPVYFTFYIVISLVNAVDEAVMLLVPANFDRQEHFLLIPGLGLVILLIVLVLVGFLTAGWMGRYFVGLGDRLMSKTPVLSGIYKTLKKIFETFLGSNSKSFRQVVFIETREDCWAIAFVTAEAPPEMGKDMICVFVPSIPVPTSGHMLIVKKSQVRKSAMTVDEGLKYVISMGAAPPETITRKPGKPKGKP